MTVTNVTTVGLSKYQVTNLKFNIDGLKLVLGLTYPQLVMTGLHETNATLNGQKLTGKGKYTATITSENCDTVRRTCISICFSSQICTLKLKQCSHHSRSLMSRPSSLQPFLSALSQQTLLHSETPPSTQQLTKTTTPEALFGSLKISFSSIRKCQASC